MKPLVAFALISVVALLGSRFVRVSESGVTSVDLGRRVYEAEGCIHCHSQFDRPDSLDTRIYGPPSPLPSSEPGAALVGNRRQGPDLSNVGLRRSREWERAHLLDPGQVTPGSRMPSYGYLFQGADQRGEALLDYLMSLRTKDTQAWLSQQQGWRLSVEPGSKVAGAALFARLCVGCHGETAKGDGPLAPRFALPPADLADGQFRFAPVALPESARREMLGRIVKYGIQGASMPGHEYLTDQEISDLVTFVMSFAVRSDRSS